MNRRQAVVFKMIYGWDNLSIELQTVLINAGTEKTKYCVDYGERDILWIGQNKLDGLCQNSLFWNALINKELVSYMRFKIKTSNSGLTSGLQSNDNSKFAIVIETTDGLNNNDTYISNTDYQEQFVLTTNYIDDKSYIKDWIVERGIEDNFDMSKLVDELKEDIKIYYNLTEIEGEI